MKMSVWKGIEWGGEAGWVGGESGGVKCLEKVRKRETFDERKKERKNERILCTEEKKSELQYINPVQ